ncbi:hypothetical protein FGU71_10835 [Erythrobacter insulae]|uniref:Uncharacterized protein n=1 Tax=Erythrobacter insulae TaxID=2584124 RepID=A0A547PDV6_9SPHN|nr:hypothetical protein [Erythrobacter insulae]TRD12309.1 hypothetical protein FGU71_10835 [Erythrobacter insulae]
MTENSLVMIGNSSEIRPHTNPKAEERFRDWSNITSLDPKGRKNVDLFWTQTETSSRYYEGIVIDARTDIHRTARTLTSAINMQDIFRPEKVDSEITALMRAISNRLSSLREYANVERADFSEASAHDCESFIVSRRLKRPGLFLLKNGNVRALWKLASKQIGLQFLGNEQAQFVILDGEGLRPNQVVGKHDLTTIEGLIEGGRFDETWRSRTHWHNQYRSIVVD